MPRHLGLELDFNDIEIQIKQLLAGYDNGFRHFGVMKLLQVIGITYWQWYNIKLTGRAEVGTIKALHKAGVTFTDDIMSKIGRKSKKNRKKLLQKNL